MNAKLPLFVVLLSALWLNGCNQSKADAEKQTKRPPQMPPAVVDVLTAKAQTVTVTENLPARLEASREAIIVPRVSGIVLTRLFEEGGLVRAGQVLYRLDSGIYDAALNTAQANLQKAQAALAQANATYHMQKQTVDRFTPLVKANAISRQTYDEALAALKVQESNIAAAKANIAAAKAAVKTAEIQLSYTEIHAPIAGQIGISQVTEGAYVTASMTPMVKIQQLDPLYVNITQSASKILKLKKEIEKGQVESNQSNAFKLSFTDGTPYPTTGQLLFADQSVEESTGQVTLRAQVANTENDLLPGLYMRVEVPQATFHKAYLIPQQAVIRGATDIVFLVNPDKTFRPQPVIISGQQDHFWIVTQGLNDNDQVIVEGTSKINMGAKVIEPRPWQEQQTITPTQQKSAPPAADAKKPLADHDLPSKKGLFAIGARDFTAR